MLPTSIGEDDSDDQEYSGTIEPFLEYARNVTTLKLGSQDMYYLFRQNFTFPRLRVLHLGHGLRVAFVAILREHAANLDVLVSPYSYNPPMWSREEQYFPRELPRLKMFLVLCQEFLTFLLPRCVKSLECLVVPIDTR